MTDYKPTAYLVRESALKNGEPSSSITLDTSASPDIQLALTDGTRLLAMTIFAKSEFKRKPPAPSDHEYEILLGATANKIARWEDLLNDCRNILIDIEETDVIRQVLDELDAELGL